MPFEADRSLPHVIIIGGGFAGLYTAFSLKNEAVRVTLIDRRNHHLFQPFLYQVATATLSPGEIAQPIRHILNDAPNIRVILAEATSINPKEKKVILADGEMTYDYLVVATGSTHSYFGHDEWQQYAPGLKAIEDATGIRNHILLAFEAAERERDEEKRRKLLSFVIVGGGPTGVEMAGAILDIAQNTLALEFKRIDPKMARVVLIEAAPRILPPFHESLSKAASDFLQKGGVEIHTGTMVTKITEGHVEADTKHFDAHTIIWAAGVAASPLGKTLGVPVDRAGRVIVEKDLSIPGHPETFVIGDLASTMHSDGKPLPALAPVAMQAGKHTGQNILRLIEKKSTTPFSYWDKGVMAVVGRHSAVVEAGNFRMKGFMAWIAWLGLHIYFLIGFRNRILVAMEWIWSYVTRNSGVRIITGRPIKVSKASAEEIVVTK